MGVNDPKPTDPGTASLQKITGLLYAMAPNPQASYAPQPTDNELVSLQKQNALLVLMQGQPGGAFKSFISKTAAYTLTPADSGQYVICSGGSWTLTLPAPAGGLIYTVRNDQGISGTTGTITLSPTGGTIDGQASIALLPQQECSLITDGTNWRSFGLKREVILGTLDITSATASATVLLPAGYRLFVLDFAGLLCSADNQNLMMTFSSDGGSTFYSSGYYAGYSLNNTASSVSGAAMSNASYAFIGSISNSAGSGASIQVKIYPGSSALFASWLAQNEYYFVASAFLQQILVSGLFQPVTKVLMNAVKFVPQSGTINNMFLTVKGVV